METVSNLIEFVVVYVAHKPWYEYLLYDWEGGKEKAKMQEMNWVVEKRQQWFLQCYT